MNNRTETSSGFAGQRQVMLPETLVASMMRERPLLRRLMAVGAGYCSKAAGQVLRRPQSTHHAIFIYCVKGGGWAELAGRLFTVRAGDLLVLPPAVPHTYGAHASNPWTIHCARAAGADLREYLDALGVSAEAPLLCLGEDLQLVRLLNELVNALEHGTSFPHLLHAFSSIVNVDGIACGKGR